ncbi:GyrI-like domain-containing protein [Legionella jordanis]|uniref:Transcription activator n=1 Tax=Legionella jordanis TaxID=456 RepID=A0A0W0VBB3_9GAMM|nr:effector binding domain-containing protein [Legionella jordanis]KTD17399.1 transcription activator [Legionella jordanis]RMX01835.1 AraC family transcriptional regulator [Legionella jordanis]RMX15499.1 AraC family transcriptional regulator [Legionella jordanis]VEH11580.1 Transcription activator, effector binding [Legionella jordanis]HAT8714654.1 AraC family transcriptional regulator [Legionella jordanis]
MTALKPVKQYVEQFAITGFSKRTKNIDEAHPEQAKIPALWQQFQESDLSAHKPAIAVYSDYESNAEGLYTITVGVAQNQQLPLCSRVEIKAGQYLQFKNNGPMPDTIIKTWQEIWGYFNGNTHYLRNFISDFEVYNGPNEFAIFIGIQ